MQTDKTTDKPTEREVKELEPEMKFQLDAHVARIFTWVKNRAAVIKEGREDDLMKSELKDEIIAVVDDFQKIHAYFLAMQLKKIKSIATEKLLKQATEAGKNALNKKQDEPQPKTVS